MASTKQGSSLEALPAELKLPILSSLCDTASLRHLVLASASYHSVYRAFRNQIFTAVTTNELAARQVHIPHPYKNGLVCLLGKEFYKSLDTDIERVRKTVRGVYSVLNFIYDYYNNHPAQPNPNPPILSVQQCKTLLQITSILPYDLWDNKKKGQWTVSFEYPENRRDDEDEGIYFNVTRVPPLAERD